MIFNDSQVDSNTLKPTDDKKWKLGIIDLQRARSKKCNQPFPVHHFENQKAFSETFSINAKTVDKICENVSSMVVRANPTIIKRKNLSLEEAWIGADKSHEF